MTKNRDNLLVIQDSYKLYRERSERPVAKQDYKEITARFMQYIVDRVLAGDTVKLPERMGVLSIQGFKPKPRLNEDGEIMGVGVNWKATKDLWARSPSDAEAKTRIFHFNEHTNGFAYKIVWNRSKMYLENSAVYEFIPAKYTFKRRIPKAVADGVEFEIGNQISFLKKSEHE